MSSKNNFKSQLSDNINTHLRLIDMHEEIDKTISLITKRIRFGVKT